MLMARDAATPEIIRDRLVLDLEPGLVPQWLSAHATIVVLTDQPGGLPAGGVQPLLYQGW
jgi:hypothetical protein